MFLWYELTPMARWAIRKAQQEPAKQTIEGRSIKRTRPVALPDRHKDLPLGILEELYPAPTETR